MHNNINVLFAAPSYVIKQPIPLPFSTGKDMYFIHYMRSDVWVFTHKYIPVWDVLCFVI